MGNLSENLSAEEDREETSSSATAVLVTEREVLVEVAVVTVTEGRREEAWPDAGMAGLEGFEDPEE